MASTHGVPPNQRLQSTPPLPLRGARGFLALIVGRRKGVEVEVTMTHNNGVQRTGTAPFYSTHSLNSALRGPGR